MNARDTLSAELHLLAEHSRAAYRAIAQASSDTKNAALTHAAHSLRDTMHTLLEANAQDMEAARDKNLSDAMLDRLMLNEPRIHAMADGLKAIAALPDPVGNRLAQWERPNGLTISRVSVPLGVIGIIYESRPNVTADAGALCLKSGNAAILRGGSESFHSSHAIVACLHEGLSAAQLPVEAIQLLPTTNREAVGIMLGMSGVIDVIIPRGGKGLNERVARESRVPTLLHLDGNCHSYVHASADFAQALNIIENAKMRRTGICGATESLVIDESIATAFLPLLADRLALHHCELRGDARACAADNRITPADNTDWGNEYLDAILSIKTVSNAEEAITHISRYSSGHTDAILATDETAIARFTAHIDSAIVMVNSSTQFADGGEFGMGAEIGIATGRLHARGPVGCEQLTTYKYIVNSEGAVRS